MLNKCATHSTSKFETSWRKLDDLAYKMTCGVQLTESKYFTLPIYELHQFTDPGRMEN